MRSAMSIVTDLVACRHAKPVDDVGLTAVAAAVVVAAVQME